MRLVSTKSTPAGLDEAVARARRAQERWAGLPLDRRLAVLRSLRHGIAADPRALAAAARPPHRASDAETLAAEVLPLADAIRWLERRATSVLRPRTAAPRGRPAWLRSTELEVRRDPMGVILVVGPGNYPLLLPGTQAVQALAAGNAVVLKPGRGGRPAALALAELLVDAGLDPDLLVVTDESDGAMEECLEAGVDKVLLTGSSDTGRRVLERLAPRLVPATMELSGGDALLVLPGADLDLVARAARFAVTFNGGATCMAPRRILVPGDRERALWNRLWTHFADAPAIELAAGRGRELRRQVAAAVAAGARPVIGAPPVGDSMTPLLLSGVRPEMAIADADLMAPVLSVIAVDSVDDAIARVAASSRGLGATVFGPEAEARRVAERLDVGVVLINDVIVPAADPRVPLAGRRDSGFGATRGAEGLLELTRPKSLVVRRGRARPHLQGTSDADVDLFAAAVSLLHAGGWRARLRALGRLAAAGLRRRPGQPTGTFDPHGPTAVAPAPPTGPGPASRPDRTDSGTASPPAAGSARLTSGAKP